jgi:hypothetical protein
MKWWHRIAVQEVLISGRKCILQHYFWNEQFELQLQNTYVVLLPDDLDQCQLQLDFKSTECLSALLWKHVCTAQYLSLFCWKYIIQTNMWERVGSLATCWQPSHTKHCFSARFDGSWHCILSLHCFYWFSYFIFSSFPFVVNQPTNTCFMSVGLKDGSL